VLDQDTGTDPSNGAIADAFDELGDLYELDGALVHRVVAYRNAARSVRDSTASVAALARAGKATELPGIGKTLQEKIVALVQTGTIPAAEKLRARFPPGLVALTRLPGLGPKRARLLYDELGIDSLDALREAAVAQRLRTVRGLGPKFEEQVLVALDAGLGEAPRAVRVILPRALEAGEQILEGLRDRAHPAEIALAGSM
jgi:DNA polymerase (family 10)